MRIARAPRFAAFDASVALTAKQAAAFYAAGYRTAFRYVDRVVSDPDSDDRWPYNLTRPELEILLDAGLYVSPVQYFSTRYESTARGKKFSLDYGRKTGDAAAVNAKALGLPEGVTIWHDLEGCPDATPEMVTDQCNGWSERVVLHGYQPGLYVGPGIGSITTGYMVGSRLYALPRYRAYWRAASLVPQIPNRGYTVIQGCEIKIAGVNVDQDMIALDHRARTDRDRFMVVAP